MENKNKNLNLDSRKGEIKVVESLKLRGRYEHKLFKK
jgi:hypothetical protein